MSEPSPTDASPAQNMEAVVHTYGTPMLPSPVPRRRRPFALSEIISWAIVLLIIGATATLIAIDQWRNPGAPASGTQVALSAKYAMGVHRLLPSPTTGRQLLAELDGTATTAENRFRLAILAGELMGEEEAVRRFEAVVLEQPELAGDVAIVRSLYGDDPPADGDLESFREKWGWFGDLAASVDKPSGDPLRQRVMNAAYWVVFTLFSVVIGGLGALFIGLALLIVALVQGIRGRLVARLDPANPKIPTVHLPRDRRTYIQAFAWFVGIYFGTSLILSEGLQLSGLLRAAIGLFVMFGSVLLALFWPRLMGGTWGEWRAAFGLHAGRGLFREVFAGIAGYLAGLPLVAAGFVVTFILIKVADVKPSHPINNALESGGVLLLIVVFLVAAVWAPLTEELMFRGALFAHLRERFGPVFSAAVVGLLFAIVHPQGWALVPVLGSIGFVFALIREWRGSIVGCMVAHALHNGLTVLIALMVMR